MWGLVECVIFRKKKKFLEVLIVQLKELISSTTIKKIFSLRPVNHSKIKIKLKKKWNKIKISFTRNKILKIQVFFPMKLVKTSNKSAKKLIII